MNKYIYDENNGFWYELQGDYWCMGSAHLRYICEYKKVFYTNLMTSGNLPYRCETTGSGNV